MVGIWLERLCAGLRILLAILMAALAIPVAMQVISRYTPLVPTYLWTEELSTFIFIWTVMIGSMVAVWDGTHFAVALTACSSVMGVIIPPSILMIVWGGVMQVSPGALSLGGGDPRSDDWPFADGHGSVPCNHLQIPKIRQADPA